MFTNGLQNTLLKFEPRQRSTCLNNGKDYFFALILLFQKFLNDPFNSDNSFNLNDVLIKTLNLCQLHDTLYGIIILNLIVLGLDQVITLGGAKTLIALRWTIRAIDLLTYVNDAVEISAIMQGFILHMDKYNLGKLFGKFVKILVQLWMEGAFYYLSKP